MHVILRYSPDTTVKHDCDVFLAILIIAVIPSIQITTLGIPTAPASNQHSRSDLPRWDISWPVDARISSTPPKKIAIMCMTSNMQQAQEAL